MSSKVRINPTGELRKRGVAENVFHLNLSDPRLSDRWNFMTECAGNARVAREIGCLLAKTHEVEVRGRDLFWKQAEKVGFAALLNLVASRRADATPADFAEWVAFSSLSLLNETVLASEDMKLRMDWAIFGRMNPDTQANVLIGMCFGCSVFVDPAIKAISAVPTAEEAARGIRVLDLATLQQPDTIVCVSVPEDRKQEFAPFLDVLSGLAKRPSLTQAVAA